MLWRGVGPLPKERYNAVDRFAYLDKVWYNGAVIAVSTADRPARASYPVWVLSGGLSGNTHPH